VGTGGSISAVTFTWASLKVLVVVGEVATKTSFGVEIEDALAVAATATGGPSGNVIVADEKLGEHHLPFVFGASVISPPELFVTAVSVVVPALKSEMLVWVEAEFCK